MRLPELATAWRARAEQLRPYAPAAAQAFETASIELEQALGIAAVEALNLRQAARESGYSREHLGRLVKAGRIPNAGRPNAPKIRLGDLPRKAGHLPPERVPADIPGTSKRQIVRSIVDLGKRSSR